MRVLVGLTPVWLTLAAGDAQYLAWMASAAELRLF